MCQQSCGIHTIIYLYLWVPLGVSLLCSWEGATYMTRVTDTKWLEQASQWHEMYCYDLKVTNSNPGRVELGVRTTSVLSHTWTKNQHVWHWMFGMRPALLNNIKLKSEPSYDPPLPFLPKSCTLKQHSGMLCGFDVKCWKMFIWLFIFGTDNTSKYTLLFAPGSTFLLSSTHTAHEPVNRRTKRKTWAKQNWIYSLTH